MMEETETDEEEADLDATERFDVGEDITEIVPDETEPPLTTAEGVGECAPLSGILFACTGSAGDVEDASTSPLSRAMAELSVSSMRREQPGQTCT